MTSNHIARAGFDRSQKPERLTARMNSYIRQAWRAYWLRRARKATMHILQSLDDRALHEPHRMSPPSIVAAGASV